MESGEGQGLLRLVEADGWKHVRTTGSHRHYKHESNFRKAIEGQPRTPREFGDAVPAHTLTSNLPISELFVNFLSMGDSTNADDFVRVIDGVQHAVIASADPPDVPMSP